MKDSLKWREILKSRKFPFLLLTISLTVILNNVGDKVLTRLMATDDPVFFTYNYSLGTLGIILLIPAVFFSIWIIKGLSKIDFGFLSSPIAIKISKFVISSFTMFFKILFKLLKFLGYAFIVLIFAIAAMLSGGSGSSSGSSSSGGYASPRPTNSNGNKGLKKDAQFQARQKQKEADHAYRYAGKQARYNINSHHFDSRVNHANSKQHEANEAGKRARNL